MILDLYATRWRAISTLNIVYIGDHIVVVHVILMNRQFTSSVLPFFMNKNKNTNSMVVVVVDGNKKKLQIPKCILGFRILD